MAQSTAAQGQPRGKTVTTTTGIVITQRQLLIIMGGIMLGILLGALDQTIVGPAMFQIIKDLKGLEHYAWVTTAYLLTSTVAVPIFGKLGDLYGRKWFFVGGIVLFMVGSALSGLSSGIDQFSLFGIAPPGLTVGMAELIFFRALQGIGGGIMFANAFTLIGDLLPPAERGRWQGLFGAVWGLASVIGPTVGGFITDNWNWKWVFYVNIPVGLIALVVLFFGLPNLHNTHSTQRKIDWLGAAALTAGITPILLGLSLGGTADFPWNSTQTLGLFAAGVLFLIAFLVIESRATEPIIPLDLFKSRIFTLSTATVFLSGVGMFGALLFIPLFIQGVQGDSATSSGNAITPMMLSLVAVSIAAGQVLSRTGKYRWLGIGGMVALTLGMFLLSGMGVGTPRWQTIAFMMIMGAGLGVAMPLYTLVVQNAFPIQRMGVVTSATQFFRSIGGTVGVALLGTIVNNRFRDEYLAQLSPQLKSSPQFGAFLSTVSPQALISPDTIKQIQGQLTAAQVPANLIPTIIQGIQAPIKGALTTATTEAFLIGAGVLAVAILTTAFIPEIALRRGQPRPVAIEGAAEAIGRDFVAEGLPGASTIPADAEPRASFPPVGGPGRARDPEPTS